MRMTSSIIFSGVTVFHGIFFGQTIGSLYSSTFLVSEPIMSRFEYDFFYRKGQGN